MPVCRHCKARISKLDKDRCPVCGELNPLEGVNSDTIEITGNINISDGSFTDYKPKKRKVFFLLSCLLGWTGIHFFYLKFYKPGLIWLAANVVILAGAFCAFYFGAHNLLLAILIPLLVIYSANITMGVITFLKSSVKDADGNLLR